MASLPRRIKILMAHGFGQSGQFFQYQARPLERAIRAYICGPSPLHHCIVEFFYIDAPIRCTFQDSSSNQRCWTRETNDGANPDLTDALTEISQFIKEHGPFDGAVAFSQGATMVAMTSVFLEPDRTVCHELSPYMDLFRKRNSKEKIQPPFKFLLSVSGPDASNELFKQELWSPQAITPILQVIGELDPMIDEISTRGLASRFRDGKVLVHYGGHFVPRNHVIVSRMAQFIADSLILLPSDDEESNTSEGTEESPSSVGSSSAPTQFRRVWKRLSGRQKGVVRISKVSDHGDFR